MDPVRRPIPWRRSVAVALAFAPVALLVACGGGSSGPTTTTTARDLAEPGARWAQLSPEGQATAVRWCRLDQAVRLAGATRRSAAPYASGRYVTVQRLAGDDVRAALQRYFGAPAHVQVPIARGCAAVVADLARAPMLARDPSIDFASPVTTGRDELRLDVTAATATLQAQVTPAAARVSVSPAAGRAPSPARARVQVADGTATIALTAIPLGTSYLAVGVSGPTGSRRILLTVQRLTPTRAQRLSAPRTFAPMVIRGEGSRGLRVLSLPRDAVATVRADGAPLAVTTAGSLLLAQASGSPGRPIRVRAGFYRDLAIASPGPWTIRFAPVRRG